MDAKSLERLEFNKILEMLREHTLTYPGRELALKTSPLLYREEIIQRQRETTQGKMLLLRETGFPWESLPDLGPVLNRLQVGGVLEPGEFLILARVLQAGNRVASFFREKGEDYPLLAFWGRNLTFLASLEREINRVITPEGLVADDASPELFRIRRSIRSLQGRIKETLENMVRSPQVQKCLQEPIVTLRGDRYVLPVRQEFRHQIKGIIHDQSASGATVFIEPMAVVELHNELTRLGREEELEVERILRELSGKAHTYREEIGRNYNTLGELDYILARAKLSIMLDGVEPEINDRGWLELVEARHPLLGEKAVPISLRVGKDFDILVVTGPNTGGKTVALKTTGLLTLMALAGLHIPARAGSTIPLLKGVYADIGDEQSIEQSLSTFSSHMTNLISFLSRANAQSLLLIDELGAGTDPQEGAALAQAILEHLLTTGARVVATTHYSELKVFAFSHPRVENASVEFDPITLSPTYRMIIGQPGHSSAFAIAARLGLAEAIVSRARELVNQEDRKVGELIADLTERAQKAQEKLQEALAAREEAFKLKEQYQRLLEEIKAKKGDILAEARTEALRLLKSTRKEIQEMKREILKALEEEGARKALTLQEEIQRELGARAGELGLGVELPSEEGVVPQEVYPGMEVYVPRLGQRGEVMAVGGDGMVQVRVNALKINLERKELRVASRPSSRAKPSTTEISGGYWSKVSTVGRSLDLRGLTVEEALLKVEKYLDDAFLAGLKEVHLIHGKGTGALRKGIQEALKGHRLVSSYRAGNYGEGGIGVTVVELKN